MEKSDPRPRSCDGFEKIVFVHDLVRNLELGCYCYREMFKTGMLFDGIDLKWTFRYISVPKNECRPHMYVYP